MLSNNPRRDNPERIIPDKFLIEIQRYNLEAHDLWISRKYRASEIKYKEMLRFYFNIQDEIKRPIHKGSPYYMIGMSILPQRDRYEEALRNILLAYIEDALNRIIQEEDEADRYPAGNVLIDFFIIRLRVLGTIKRLVYNYKERNEINSFFDPIDILNDVAKNLNYNPSSLLSLCLKTPQLPELQPLGFPQPWEKRVFVGGNYTTHRPNIRKISEVVSRLGYTPVVADEVYIEPEFVHHHTLLLLHTCAYAIIDISSQAGQLIEIERTFDYETKLLLVWAAPNQETCGIIPSWVTRMVRTMRKEPHFIQRGYTDFDQINDIVTEFFSSQTSTSTSTFTQLSSTITTVTPPPPPYSNEEDPQKE